ncbi:MAG: hypothetical protein A3J29_06275 [Acidobacteria bacterium RIFCSPLOWO2_12_FULL_67_14b]|nr:MAG: hypothetical protein A3J29_06275 [Acidobacteria bacterium RIFCSPLOWO2_12_FULL_67_14b]
MRRLLVVGVTFLTLSPQSFAQAPARIDLNALVFVEDSDFGQALSAAILKKKVPVLVTTARDKAQFFLEETSNASKEGAAERVTKVLAFGVFAGSGKSYEASVTMTNADGTVLFAHNAKKKDMRGAAEDVANKLNDHIKRQPRP